MASIDTVIIGAGPTGLSAAYHIGKDSLLLEQNDRVGGWCRSIEDGGFTFDFAGHIMFSNDPYVHRLYDMLVGDNVHWQQREAWIFSKNTYTRYPFQGSLYGLPPEVVTECILGAIEARFGAIAAPSAAGDAPAPPGSVKQCACDAAALVAATAMVAARSISPFPTIGSSGRCRSPRWRRRGSAAGYRCPTSPK